LTAHAYKYVPHLHFFVIMSILINYWRSPLRGKPFWETNFGFTTYCQGMRAFHEIKIWCTGISNGNNNLKQHIRFKAISIAIMGFWNVTLM